MKLESIYPPSEIDIETASADSTKNNYLYVKEYLDSFLAVVLLVLSAPLLAVLMILVRATSRGPALYRQVRLGLRGRPYTIYKLRTMVHDCERISGPQWATTDDPRITPLGRILRRSHLDELPQLWNVLRGEMSLIGPRPERPEFVEQLKRVHPNYAQRLQIRPGVTGLAQVQLPPDEEVHGVRRKLEYDLYYIHRLNFWLDVRIFVATLLKVLGMPFSLIRWSLLLPTQYEVATAPIVAYDS